ncbi:protein translocase subunit SecD [Candidatus Methylacidithermus pantelleriae]|uniref:Multifunctional fusion protein n=1 Tax=Candidatus Methylacidithermus pantelleriae TaxID=2744239 RepID=A0A8J2BS54_9BACT|nr:protein translocase subunit SecD [Candidatus Methylacidithermus pantelleriae]CAF0703519.1 Protein-export membrane protein SecF,Protein translocase subunit SecD [Candidatus Methylacidithermus pantelleriae]
MNPFWIFLAASGFVIALGGYFFSDQPKRKRLLGLSASICAILLSFLSLYPLEKTVRLGLDLKGGTAFLIELEGKPSPQALEQAVAVIRKRVDKFGLSEPIIQPVGHNRISVQIPGLSEEDKKAARDQLSRVAKLEFKLVHPDSARLLAERASGKPLPIDYEALPVLGRDGKRDGFLVVKRRPELTGKFVRRAFRGYDEVGRPTVVIQFSDEGQRVFGAVTSRNVGRQLAIVLDGEIRSAPVIQTAIYNNATISGGNMTPAEAEELASVLENPLETPVRILEERGVDPSLGRDSILRGRNAGFVALGLVVGFMVLYYRLAGVIAVGALLLNLLLLFGLLAQFHFTLTLPGIAGIILTIGMAVDANVLIYERIRDELALGKPLATAVSLGFERAFSAIFDSNVSTILPATVLMFLGSGPLQGFAVTLTLGIVANLFTAVVATRNGFEWLLDLGKIRHLLMMQFLKNPRFDFLRYRIPSVCLAGILLLAGTVAFFGRQSELLGVDFVGGDAVTLSYREAVPVASIRSTLEEAGIHPMLLQYAKDSHQILLQTRYGEGDKAASLLVRRFGSHGFTKIGLDSVGPTVGNELKWRAIQSLSLGLVAILVYVAFRYEWSFSVAAAAGQIHDVLMAVGGMALLGHEFTMTLVGAFLTILGYSINEKIVISDRIRELMRIHSGMAFRELVNRGLNLTLARTVITGGTVLLATLSMLLLGGPVISDFALAIFIGVVAGLFSSHFLSPALLYWFHELAQPVGSGRKVVARAKGVV